jgi:tetratricopeptide (TPR) repeat protein
VTDTSQPTISPWQKLVAYTWYAWGRSLCYWGIRTADTSFYRAGIDSFGRALRAWPHFSASYYQRGLIRSRELGEHRQGIEDLSQAITLSPDWPPPYLQRGLIQRFHGDARAAISDLQRYIELEQHSSWRDEAQRQIAMLEEDLRGETG